MVNIERTAELCAPDDEAEALALEAELRDHGIAPLLVRAGSPLPGVGTGAWGTIRVPAGDLERARAIAAAWYEREDEDIDDEELARQAEDAQAHEEQRRGLEDIGSAYRAPDYPKTRVPRAEPVRSFPIWPAIAIVSLALNVFLGAWALREPEYVQTTEAYDARGRVTATWRWGQSAYPLGMSGYDTDGRRTMEISDRDGDGREESSVSFDREGRRACRSYDRDEDGWYERSESFGAHGELVSVSHDADDDGRWDRIDVRAGGGREAMELRDRDGDGHFETMVCESGELRIACP